ncbi:MAG: HlyD family type I secretion periplasmic adaptor subunit [Hyphomonadaceae bacterium]|nr:HlyD family type I secretion periplasmic adaptor subunit [Hyphomonadaceae bacterium]
MWDFLKRHLDIIGDSLVADRARRKALKPSDETAFLPAALEILETPPNPLGRTILWGLMAFLVIALIWAALGRIDIVAVAEGKLAPLGQVKIIQAADGGIVRAIHVHEGDSVEQGAPLLELDPTVTDAEVEQARAALEVAEIDRARAAALMQYANTGSWRFAAPKDADPVLVETQRAIVAARIREHQAMRGGARDESTQRRSDIAMVAADVGRIEAQLPLVEGQLAGLRKLEAKGLAPRMRVMEVEERAVGMRADLLVRNEENARARAAHAGALQKVAQIDGTFRREALDAFNEADAAARLRRQELNIAEQKRSQTILSAPDAGVVQQLQVHTVGGVVKPADPLMVIVPRGAELIVEVMVLNRDAGFVREGQPVEVKLEAYPFTRYGVVEGVLEHISRDAIKDETRGLVYAARVKLTRRTIVIDGDMVNLSAGLSAQAEIRTGQRRVIEFLLSPLAKRVDEAGRER